MDDSMGDDKTKGRSAQQPSAVTVSIHPLVILNISEHWTRLRAQSTGGSPVQIFGAVLGKQIGRHLELINSFEVKWDDGPNGFAVIDEEYFRSREEQYKDVFVDLDFMGWYTSGPEAPTESDLNVHKQFCHLHESPIMLKLDPTVKVLDKLPLSVFESIVDAIDESSIQWHVISWSIASEQAERIGIDHVARVSTSSSSTRSTVNKLIMGQLGAVNMLLTRLRLIDDYLNAVKKGVLVRDEGILREVAQLCQGLPLVATKRFQEEFGNQCDEVKMTTYLGAVIKICGAMNDLASKVNVIATDRYTAGFVQRRIAHLHTAM
ncbi:hypothetical protein AB6A40_000937 [Gnathostoma spinigerum]|uniref:COP9 signalosome complex subunit 6 n=1 Tax=Gnathostoma spinigerum TaxID=75299 RepID=A0ABD6E331_9BILA